MSRIAGKLPANRWSLIYEKNICPECNSKLGERERKEGFEIYCEKCKQVKAVRGYSLN